MKPQPSDSTPIGTVITLNDDYTGEPFTYEYKGGPFKRFATAENREAFLAGNIEASSPLEFIDWLIEMNIIRRDPEGLYRVEGRAIPQHLHLLLDDVFETVATDQVDEGVGDDSGD